MSTVYINARFLTQPMSGVQRYATELVLALDDLLDRNEVDRSKHEFVLLHPARGRVRPLPVRHMRARGVGRFRGHAWEQFELPRHVGSGLLFCPGNTAPLASLWGRQRIVVTVHDLAPLYFPSAYRASFRLAYRALWPLIFRHADAVITVSHAEKRAIVHRFPAAEGKLHVVANGAASRELHRILADEPQPGDAGVPERPFVLYVGSLCRRKNLQGFLDSLAILNRSVDVPAIVAGAGARAFSERAFTLPPDLVGKVEFRGRVEESELVRLYRRAHCLVFPSLHEASGLPPTEAMACGCPVVASLIPALVERCQDASVYCDPEDPADIAEQVRRVMEDARLRDQLRRKGLERAESLSWERCAHQTVEVFDRALAA